MCNHYRGHPEAIPTWAEYAGFRRHDDEWSDTKIDVWPKEQGLVVRTIDGEPTLDAMRWGVPCTMKGKRPGTKVTKPVTNVRNLDSSFWRSMLMTPERRCLVPFTTFAEPKPGKDPETGRPDEYWFSVPSQAVACFAGIWRPTEAGNAFAFVTTEPNPLVAPLHLKAMPVILHETDYRRWLTADWGEARLLVAPFPSQLMASEGGTKSCDPFAQATTR